MQAQPPAPASATATPLTWRGKPSPRNMPTDELKLALSQAPHFRMESELNRYKDRRTCAGTRTTPTPTLDRISPHDFLDMRYGSTSPSIPSRPSTAQGGRKRSADGPPPARFASRRGHPERPSTADG